jgi:hypothetical protein
MGCELSAEAVAAVNGTIAARFKGNLAGTSAICADGVKHHSLLAPAGGILLARSTAIFAALRFVGKPFFREEFLLAGGEGEVLSAIFADDVFVAKHELPSFLFS